MNWIRTFGTFEIFIIAAFVLVYAAFIYRIVSSARALNVGWGNLIIKAIIRTAYFVLLLIALLGPSFGEASREVKAVGKDIFVAVDLSESMNAHDIQPTRLERIKFELKK